MKNWLMRMGGRLARFMYGRYGNDSLNRVLFIAALVFMLLTLIPQLWWMTFLSWGLLIWATFRCYSRSIAKRRRELLAWQGFWGRVRGFFSLTRSRWRDRKTHRYFKCSKCRVTLRVPRGKGMLDVTCPKCKAVTVRKT